MPFRLAAALSAACALLGAAELAAEASQPKTEDAPVVESVARLAAVPRSLRREVMKEVQHRRATRPKKPSTIMPGLKTAEAVPKEYGIEPRRSTSSGLPEIEMRDFANLAMQSGPTKPVNHHRAVHPRSIDVSGATSMYKRAAPAKDGTQAKAADITKASNTQQRSVPATKGSTQVRRASQQPKAVDVSKLTNMYKIRMPSVSQPQAQPKAQPQVQSKSKHGSSKHSHGHGHHHHQHSAAQDHSQVDSDHDSVPDAVDSDDDNDGITDNYDKDNVNYGISDAAMKAQIKAAVDLRAKKRTEAAREISKPRHSAKSNLQEYKDDFDLDGIKNSKDLDDDNDGITDDFDKDSNNDGIPDKAKPTLMDWRN